MSTQNDGPNLEEYLRDADREHRMHLGAFIEKLFIEKLGFVGADVANIVQGTFVELAKRLEDTSRPWDFEKSPKNWLYRVAYNKSMTILRLIKSRGPHVSISGHVAEGDEQPEIKDDRSKTPAEILLKKEETEAVEQVIDKDLKGLHQVAVETWYEICPCTAIELQEACSAKIGHPVSLQKIKSALEYGKGKLTAKISLWKNQI